MRNGLLIDYEFCSGCHSCEVACKEEHGFPVGKWGIRLMQDGPWEIDGYHMNWNKIPVVTDLCDLCEERTAAGRKPTCMHHCLAQCITFGPLDELMAAMEAKPRQLLFVPDAERARGLIACALADDEGAPGYDFADVDVSDQRLGAEQDRPEEQARNDSYRNAYNRYDASKGNDDNESWG